MRGCHQLHTAFSDGARCRGFQFGADFVDHDDLRHMIFHCLDHHRVLFRRASHLHATRSPDPWMGNIAVARDFVRGVHHDYSLVGLVREHASYFTQQGGFTHAWATKNQDRLTLLDDIAYQRDTAKHRSTNAAGEANHFPFTIAQRADAMERALDASAVVVAKFTDTLDHVFEVGVGDRLFT